MDFCFAISNIHSKVFIPFLLSVCKYFFFYKNTTSLVSTSLRIGTTGVKKCNAGKITKLNYISLQQVCEYVKGKWVVFFQKSEPSKSCDLIRTRISTLTNDAITKIAELKSKQSLMKDNFRYIRNYFKRHNETIEWNWTSFENREASTIPVWILT